ncbi:MAG: nucleoside diphosphate kinase regulator [Desulfobacterales bacterium]|nr:nucleoside diphosphate kinase regulator [Desulfobacterales bacterium]
MKYRTIYITSFDLMRLEDVLAVANEVHYRDRKDLEALDNELANAKILNPKDVPPDVVTMNSKVQLVHLDTGETNEYTLVFPREADIDQGKLSIISPIGTAIIGYSEGDEIEWQVPAGVRRIKIKKILYQPEAAGDFNI